MTKFSVIPGIYIQGNNCIIPRKIKVAAKEVLITWTVLARTKSCIFFNIGSRVYQTRCRWSSLIFYSGVRQRLKKPETHHHNFFLRNPSVFLNN
jgi:hypothetical protein